MVYGLGQFADVFADEVDGVKLDIQRLNFREPLGLIVGELHDVTGRWLAALGRIGIRPVAANGVRGAPLSALR